MMIRNMKKNILIFANTTGCGQGISGGAQMLFQVFKRIRNNFSRIYYYTNLNDKALVEKEIAGVDFIFSPDFFDRFNIFISYVLKTLGAIFCVKPRDIDIIYSSSDFFPDVIPSFFYKLFHPKVKWYQCIFHIYRDWRKRPGNKIVNFIAQYSQKFSFLLIKKADCIININYQVREVLIKKGFDSNKIFVNNPGINFDYLDKIEKSGIKYDATFLANVHPSKGVFDLVDIWEIICRDRKDAKLAIIGGGYEETKAELKKKMTAKGLENNIHILGFLERDKAFSLIKSSRIFIFPSHEEGFGIAIAEAMACGVPVIAWNLPVYDEVFKDYLIKISENDVGLFVESIIDLFNNKTKTHQLASRARNFVKKYDWEEISCRHLEILTKEIIHQ